MKNEIKMRRLVHQNTKQVDIVFACSDWLLKLRTEDSILLFIPEHENKTTAHP